MSVRVSLARTSPFVLALLASPACHVEEKAAPTPPPLSAPAAAPAATSEGEAPDARAEFIRSRYTKYEYRIPMRDGVRLFTAVYVPNDASPSRKYPFLMMRTPYSVAPYGADRYRERMLSEAFEREGFIFVHQDVRGRFMSEGEFVNVRPHLDKKGPKDIDESTDTYDTLEWLTKNVAGNNGRAGMLGVSYPGFYSSAGAIDSHPALKAVSPQAPIGDWFRGDDVHRHGAFNLQLAFHFFASFDKPRPKPKEDSEDDWEGIDYGTPDAYRFFLSAGPLSEAEAKHFKGERPFFREIVAHPNYDAFWQARNILPHLRNIKAAVLVVGGFYDTEDLYGPLATYRAIEAQNPGAKNSIVMGPWKHGGWWHGKGEKLGDAEFGFATSVVLQELELAFFKHHLKDGPDPELAEALVFEAGANRFRRFDAWPPREAKKGRLYLQASGALSFEPPKNAEAESDEYMSDPDKPVPYTQEMANNWSTGYMAEDQRFASRRPDVLEYRSEPLERDVTLAGPLEADLWVSTTGTDADWVVKLIDENPGKMPGFTKEDRWAGKKDRGGQQILVRGEPFRGRFRESYEAPKPFVPGEPTKVKFAVNDVFHTFKKGHRIVIQVQSTWFPFIDRNPQKFVPNIFEAKPSDYMKATHRVYRSQGMPSALEVTILRALDE
ncbi:CocE/NonD family hydrolase [Polyangium mundeleinium]|uniref:CocE/NonD family hydrolase n=1 Tax=Polyangium mundeleinium TaxID=2995306 RepID=A0ABT5EYL0_9BACT|nr:CocE/NonD family hydrolase [Polyangium mundeleinium]MDC0746362.1 CocE/NonD family hydrolase [Polyangium mundeleinium]